MLLVVVDYKEKISFIRNQDLKKSFRGDFEIILTLKFVWKQNGLTFISLCKALKRFIQQLKYIFIVLETFFWHTKTSQ